MPDSPSSKPALIDVSPILSERLAVWPGDQEFRRQVSLSIAAGDNIGLSAIEGSVHMGAHADAPSHYSEYGQGIAARPLEPYVGICQLIRLDLPRGSRILPEHLRCEIRAPRILFQTGSYPDPDHWNSDFCALSPELVDFLAHAEVRLVGLDTPSIDLYDDRVLLSHQRVALHDMSVLEGLVLEHVPAGLYSLIAPPLKIEGADAAPLRALLLDDGGRLG